MIKTNTQEINKIENESFPENMFRHIPIVVEIPFTTDMEKYHESMLNAASTLEEKLNERMLSMSKSGLKFFTSKIKYINIPDSKENELGLRGKIEIVLFSENQ